MCHVSTSRNARLAVLIVLLSASTLVPVTASAQQWVANRSYTEGIGIKLGSSLVFHPGLGVEAGYDSNVFFADEDSVGAARLRIVPTLALATLPPQRLDDEEGGLTGKKPTLEFRFGFAGIYEDWFGKDQILDDRRDFGIQTDVGLVIFPYGKFRLRLYDEFARSIRAPNEAMVANYTLDRNTAGIGFSVVPGTALEVGLDYRYTLNFYELPWLRTAGNYHKHDINLSFKWKFLPKTAFVFTGRVSPYMRWGNSLDSAGYVFPLSDSVDVSAMVGLVGLFTPRFGLALNVGYGAAFFGKGDDFDSFIGNAELRFFVTPMSAIRAGFIRDIQPSYFTNYYERNEWYLAYEQLIAGRVLLSAKFRLGYWKYAVLYQDDGAGVLTVSDAFTNLDKNHRVDWPVLKAMLFAEYRITDWIAINATFEYTGNFTDTRLASTVASGAIPESYNKFEVFGGVRAMY